MKLKDEIELDKKYGAVKETIEFVSNLFTQADIRYEYFSEAIIVAGFIDNNAIVIEEKSAPANLENIKLEKPKTELDEQMEAAFKINFLSKKRGYEVSSSLVGGGKTFTVVQKTIESCIPFKYL